MLGLKGGRMAKDPQRVFIIVIVVVFLLSTLAFTGVIVYSIIGDSADQSVTEFDQEQLNELMEEEAVDPEDRLQGTRLAGFDPITEPVTEIETIDIVEGDGAEVQSGDAITAHYSGAYAVNGEIFESSRDSGQPFSTELGNLIAGWQEGIPGMKEGGTRRLVIPGELAYGEAPEGYTPGEGGQPLGPLVFDIELISVQ